MKSGPSPASGMRRAGGGRSRSDRCRGRDAAGRRSRKEPRAHSSSPALASPTPSHEVNAMTRYTGFATLRSAAVELSVLHLEGEQARDSRDRVCELGAVEGDTACHRGDHEDEEPDDPGAAHERPHRRWWRSAGACGLRACTVTARRSRPSRAAAREATSMPQNARLASHDSVNVQRPRPSGRLRNITPGGCPPAAHDKPSERAVLDRHLDFQTRAHS